MPRDQQTFHNYLTAENIIHESTAWNGSNFRITNPHTTSDPLHGFPNFDEIFRESVFPCLHPSSRHMSDEEARYNTFLRSTNWPRHRIVASPRDIARAGFFCLDSSDRVKCYYCGGGLENWERNDDPWKEHAKWYPTCEYLLQKKGPDYVHMVAMQNQTLSRPNIVIQRSIITLSNEPVREVHSRSSSASGYSRQPSTPIQIIDPQVEEQRITNRVDEAIGSELSRRAQDMGFDVAQIRSAMIRRLQNNRDNFANLGDLVDAILSLPPQTTNIRPSYHEEATSSINLENLEGVSAAESARELRRLQEARKCKICHNDRACMVLIPCGHLACCVNCGRDVADCPVCHSAVDERVRSYIV